MRTERIRIVPASPAHVGRIATRMRAEDRRECMAKGRDPKTALRLGLRASVWAVTAMADGSPIAMFGVAPVSVVADRGNPWFLGTDAVLRYGREFLLHGPAVVERMQQSFTRLDNSVSISNGPAIRMLERWGFTLEDDPYEVGGVWFVKFWRDENVRSSTARPAHPDRGTA